MKFRKDENNTIHCVITEEEIEELGYTLEDIVSNGARTQEFMNRIFDLAETNFDMKFEGGPKAVRADILPDHTLALTFSEHPAMEGMIEHIREMMNGILGTEEEQKPKTTCPANVIALFAFDELEAVMRYARQVRMAELPPNELYKFEDGYFLMVDMTHCTESEARYLSSLTDEYSAEVFVGSEKRAFLWEHGRCLVRENAIETLREI